MSGSFLYFHNQGGFYVWQMRRRMQRERRNNNFRLQRRNNNNNNNNNNGNNNHNQHDRNDNNNNDNNATRPKTIVNDAPRQQRPEAPNGPTTRSQTRSQSQVRPQSQHGMNLRRCFFSFLLFSCFSIFAFLSYSPCPDTILPLPNCTQLMLPSIQPCFQIARILPLSITSI